ncbi:HYR domain-containing protein [Sphingobacteriales bacterium UPWRP_1]|nr:hypothetical protein B6N25_07120 [Sphingobacteriales bacterium TSM_CSS]PSJ74846.1 HYR domain-containing protein [Sphingobacteriales bacterium UPWRP_1]
MQCLKVPNIAVLLLLLLLAVAGGVKAQVSLYTFSQSTGTYTPITGGTILGSTANNEQRFLDPANPAGSATDNSGPGFPIGFNFAYNGLMFDRIGIHTNGWISLGNSLLTPGVDMTSVSYLAPLSSSAVITPEYLRSRIAAVGADLQGQSNSELRVQTIGTAPNRVCVVQWTNYRRASQTAMLLNFQIRLNEAGNTVAIMFGNMVFGSLTNTADVGLGGFTDADFNNRRTVSPHNWNSTLAGTSNISKCTMSSTAVPPVNGRTFLFSPPACQAPYLWPVSIFSATTATINFTCTACTGTYVVEYGPPDFVPGAGVSAGTGGTAIVGSASPVVISGLLPLTYYDVYVRQDCGGAFSPNSGVQSFLTRPPGDDVCSPLTLTAGLNTGFTNSYASVQSNEPLPLLVNCNVQNAWCPDDGGLQNSLWFTFTPLQDGLYNFDCYGFNTQAALWQAASCSALLSGGGNLLAANDDGSTTQTLGAYLQNVCLLQEQTYFLQVDGYNGAEGPLTVNITFAGQPPAPTITCPANIVQSAGFTGCSTYVNVPLPVVNSLCSNYTLSNNYTNLPNASALYTAGITVVTYSVTSGANTNTCSFSVTVTNPQPPVVSCQNIAVTLSASGTASITPSAVFAAFDACFLPHTLVSVQPALFTCANVGSNTVTLTAADSQGNTATCAATVAVTDVLPPVVACQNTTVALNASGSATATPAALLATSSDNCTTVTPVAVSPALFTCANIGSNTATLTVQDASGNTATCTAQVLVQDQTPPAVVCQPFTVTLNALNTAVITPSNVFASGTDNCTTVTPLSVTPNSFGCQQVGNNTVTLVAADGHGNTSSCSATVTVNYAAQPAPICQNIGVTLNSLGMALVFPANVFAGSTDNCGALSPVAVNPALFTCSQVGQNTVTLFATDGNGNTSSCTATITVSDVAAPVAQCQNASVQLNAQGQATITPATLNNNSTDNCGITQLTLSQSLFTCNNTGNNTVTLTVADASGNTATCNAQLSVSDVLPPAAICQNVTVALNASGNYTLNGSEINNGSTDNCAITALSVTPNLFTCANIGSNTVTLTVADASGNTATCAATVMVLFTFLPDELCKNATVALSPAGNATILPSDVFLGNTDNCAGISPVSVTPQNFGCANVGSNTVTLTVVNGSGFTSSCNATVTVTDNQSPNAACQNTSVNLLAGGTASIAAAQINNGSADNCGIAQVQVFPNSFTCANIGANTVTLTVTDVNGNSSTCTAQVVVNDNLPPVAQCQNQTVFLNASGTATVTAAQVNNGSTDNCSITAFSVTPNVFTCADIGSNTVTLTASDAAGNTGTCAALVTVVFDFLPVDVCRNYAVELNSSGDIGILPADVFIGNADECGGVSPVLVTPNTFTCANVGLNTVTLTVVNTAGSTTTCNATVTISDSQPPVMQCQNQPVSLSASGNASITAAQVNNGSSDNCGISQLTVWPTSFTCLQVGSNTVTLTASDASGNTQTCQAIITVADNLSPVMQCQNTTVVLNNTGTALLLPGQVNNGSADNCSISQLTVAPDFFTCANAGSNTVTLTAVDAGGNTGTCSAIVQVTLPFNGSSFCKNAEVSLTASGTIALPASAVFTGSVPDACGIIDAVSVSPAVFTCANVGINTVTLTTANSIGNTGTCTAQVAVADNLPPQLVCPSNVTSGNSPNTCGANLIIPAPSANDNCALLSVENNKNNTGNASGFYNPGTTTVTFTATDVNGNSSSCSFAVTVNDTQPPVVACPANIAVNNTACTQVVNWAVPAATDNCAVASLVAGITPGSVFSTGVTTVDYTAQDESGNTSTCSFTVTIADTSPPAIVCPDNIAQTAVAGTCSAAVNWTLPQVTDACSGAVISNASHSPGTNFNTGITVVAYTAADSWGNTATCSFTITITDTQPPQITCPAAVVAPAVANSCQAALTIPLPVALDNCQISGLVNSYTGASNASGIYSTGVNTVTYTAADATGNTATCSFTVSVTDTQLPQITCPQNMVQTVSGTTCFSVVVVPLPAVTDNCAVAGYTNNFTGTANASGAYLVGATTIVYTANDVNGNTASCSFTVTVNDAIAPVIVSCPANIIKPAIAGTCSATANWNTPVASDNCSAITLVASTPSGSTFNAGTTVVTYTATDVSGNTTTCSFTVTITDTTPPVISCPANISSCSTTPLWPSPNASDACLLGNITSNYAPGGYLPPGVNTITYTATDVSGNTATCSFTVTINNPVTLVTSTSSFNGNGVTCFGASNGIANAIAIGGTLPFTYQWSNGTTGAFVSGLPAGTYTVTVADALGCSATSSVVLTQPPPIVCSVNTTAASCANVNNGTATAVITGTGTYNYNWSGPVGPYVNASHLTGLSPGVYTVTVTNALGCTCSASGMVNSPPITGQLAGTLTTVSGGVAPLLYNFSTIAFTGGTAPYTFAWNTSGYVQYSTTSGNINIIYTNTSYWAVTISDNDPCTEGELVFSSAPDIDFGVLTILTATVTGDSGGSNGSITLTVIGGTPCSGNSYHYNWLGPSNWFPAGNTNTPNLTGLPSGWYVVSITDCGPDGVFNTGDEQEAYGYYWIAKAIRGRGKDAPPDAGMLQVIPNPISNDSQLRFIIPEDGYVTIALFDITGREQKVLYSQLAQGGLMYQIPLSSNLALVPGVYICQLRTDGGYRLQERIVWVK